ncbi:hypothetical protein CROQUDRAFT_96176 [Cronartium quercuum f. sp. fusiforme G11]|uniref:Uncharacterized protein n=1 Tax=Cronartium quercuum f. sp. fusiforme G11 TaxID=708437 RepID=A0A9P6TAG3_9BASI|nr:hypothetical protein CROQUDRAFT_96176 [Cronartium quercuum f. sp. fusiforme G11]
MNSPTDAMPPNLCTSTTTPQQINEDGLIFQPGGLNVQQTQDFKKKLQTGKLKDDHKTAS